MSNYPTGFDNNITLPGVSGSSQEDMAITALRSAVFAIEIELGITPSGIYQDVRTRLDILESRLQFGVSPSIPNDGYVKSPLFIWNVPQNVTLSISDGYGAPTENRVDGSLYMRGIDGYANNELYIRRNGAWYPIQTDQFVANCDLDGTYLCQEVVGIRTKPASASLQSITSFEDGYHLTWNGFAGYWEAQTGFIPGHDLGIFSGPYGRTGQTVIGLQGFPLSGVAPTDGYTLVWQASDNRWEPQARAVIFDGYVSRVNLRSNRAFQSPILNTKTGIVNFGTSTNGTGGATENYSIILGGDRNVSSGIHSMVGGGFSNSAQDGYSLVLHGNTNTATLSSSTVINGTTNLASANNATVINGTSNVASGANSNVSNGTSNVAAASFSSVLNGNSNTITAGSNNAIIGSGSNNQINGGGASTFSIILGGSTNSTNAQNVLLGTPASALVQSNYSIVLSGTSGTIGTTSDYSFIGTGNTNSISSASGFSFIGTGNLITATGLYATVLNATTATANGLHSLVLNGNTQSVTGSYSTLINGNNNTISGPSSYATIVDGYQNTVSSMGGLIVDGYNNAVSGQWSSIVNGNFNINAGRNSSILNGASNNIDSASGDSTILSGNVNSIVNTTHSLISGYFNSLNNGNNSYVLGSSNTVLSPSSKIIGSFNTVGTGGSLNRIFGNSNVLNAGSISNSVMGNANNLSPLNVTRDNAILGSNNVVDGYGGSTIVGQSNIVTANFSGTNGQFARTRLFGQQVHANSRFTQTTIAVGSNNVSLPTGTINVVSTTGFPSNGVIAIVTTTGLQAVSYTSTNPTQFLGCTGGTGVMSTGGQVGKIGEAQWSRLILSGKSTSGAPISLQLQDSIAVNPTFVDGYSYDMSIRLLIVNTNPISPNPVVPARHQIDVLAHQESGILVIDNINITIATPNTVDSLTRTPWTFTVAASGNQLVLTVDSEAASSYVQPSNTASDRRAIATVEMREISRI